MHLRVFMTESFFKQEITRYLSDGGIGALLMADVDYFDRKNDNLLNLQGQTLHYALP